MAHGTISSPSYYQQENERRRVVGRVTGDMQKTRKRDEIERDMDQQRRRLIDAGVPKEQLPEITRRMSPQDAARKQVQLNDAARDPRLARQPMTGYSADPGVGRRTGMPLPQPAGATAPTPSSAASRPQPASQQPVSPLDHIQPMSVADQRALESQNQLRREVTPVQSSERVPIIPGGDPAARAFNKRASTPEPTGPAPTRLPASVAQTTTPAPLQALTAAAGTGQGVQTPYGTVSSTVVKAGTPEAPTVVTETGVKRLTPFEQVVKNHPQVAIANTPENLAYVKAYKAAQADPDGEKDPVKLGLNLFNPKKTPDGVPPRGVEVADNGLTAPLNVPAIGGPVRPVPFAGADAGVADWKRPTAESTGAQVADSVRTRWEKAMEDPMSPKNLVAGAKQAIQTGTGNVVDFFRHLNDPNAPSAVPRAPATVSNDSPWWSEEAKARTEPGAQMADVTPLPAYPFSSSGANPGMRLDMPGAAPSQMPFDGSQLATPAVPPASGGVTSQPAASAWKPGEPSTPTPGVPMALNGYQDDDLTAFAANPAEDQFRKKMREPQTTWYT